MRRHQEQDRARFERIYHDTYPAVTGYVLRRTTDAADAADAVAETYFTLWRRIGELPLQADPRLWLYGVARRVLANQRRTVRRSTALTVKLAGDFVRLRPEGDAGPDLAQVAAAFRRLSDRDRELLALVGWEGLDRDQIAVTLGVSRSVVRLRLHRARQRFGQELDKDGIRRGSPAARLEPVTSIDSRKATS